MRAALRPMPYRAVVLAIVRRGSCDCALRPFSEEGTKRTNGKRAPRPYGRGGARFGTGARPAGRSHAAVHALTCRLPRAAVHTVMRCGSCARAPLDMRPRCGSGDRAALAFAIVRCGHFQRKERNGQTETRPSPVRAGGARFGTGRIRSGVWPDFSRRRGRRGDGARLATNRTIFVAVRGRCVRHDGWPKRFLRRGRRGDGGAACGVRLTGLFSWRGGARRGCHTARALAACGRLRHGAAVRLARI